MIDDFDELEDLLQSKEVFESASKLKLDWPFSERLRDSLGEARHILNQLPLEFMAGRRVLEVGAGLGIVSAYLEKKEIKIEAVEPAASIFGDNWKLLPLVRQTLEAKFPIHTCSVENLSAEKNGSYDVIFSHNVVEHMMNLEKSFLAMRRLLAPNGFMVHSCANYHFPYEPHFGVWLVPFSPSLTRFFSSKVRKNPAIWGALNFVTAAKIEKLARQIGCSAHFQKGLMYETLMRLEKDPAFAARQTGWPRRIYHWLKQTTLLECVRFFPAHLATPMTVYLEPISS